MKIKEIPHRITLSKNAGSCFGVNRALQIVSEESQAKESLFTFGPLIHNPRVIRNLEANKILSLTEEEIGNLPARSKLVLRAHGTSPEIEDELKERKLCLIDATCPFVKKAQEAAKHFYDQGFLVVIVGEKGHPEVESLLGYAPSAQVVGSVEEAKEEVGKLVRDYSFSGSQDTTSNFKVNNFETNNFKANNSQKTVGLLSQTTQREEVLIAIKKVFENTGFQVLVENTICQATRKRQESANKLAQEMDVMVVLGGKNSANTTRLAAICRALCPTLHIEVPEEIEVVEIDDFLGKNAETLREKCAKKSRGDLLKIGITAGASTPHEHIQELIERLEKSSF